MSVFCVDIIQGCHYTCALAFHSRRHQHVGFIIASHTVHLIYSHRRHTGVVSSPSFHVIQYSPPLFHSCEYSASEAHILYEKMYEQLSDSATYNLNQCRNDDGRVSTRSEEPAARLGLQIRRKHGQMVRVKYLGVVVNSENRRETKTIVILHHI